MNIVSAQGIAKTHGLKELFSGLSFGLEERDRIGLIGRNGCGKSTLLQILARAMEPDAGQVTWRQDLRVQYLSQNPEFLPGQTVLEYIFASSEAISSLLLEYESVCARLSHDPHSAVLLKQFDEVSRRMDAASAWDYETLARTILGKLGIADLETRVDLLSGGYRKRVALAHALLTTADLLILDEPTNHLDADTVSWLEDYLRRFTGAVLLVTHDRYFLDRVTERIWELDGGELREFEGNFSYYLGRKAELEAAALSQQDRRRAILRKELEWLKRGARARTTKQKARIDRIHALQEIPGISRQEAVSFPLETRRMGKKACELKAIFKAYDGRTVISDFSYTFKPGERLGIIGPNGSGKTTLANIITGRVAPDRGEVSVGQTVEFGYFDQESTEFDPAERALDYVKREGGDMLRGTDGSTLGAALVMERFFFTPQMLYTPIEKLSGGERRRLYLVRTLMRNPNFLVLDEPANDLDIPTLQALEDFLDGYSGCLLVISHDRYFLDRTIDQLLSIESGGRVRGWPGDYSLYERMRAEQEQEDKAASEVASVASPTSRPKGDGSKPRKLSFNEQRELARLEAEIPDMEGRLRELEEEMAAAATEYVKLQALSAEQKQLAARVEQAVERWTELASRT